jgi:DNA-directed RNA polymerase specialized sigma24 family protein
MHPIAEESPDDQQPRGADFGVTLPPAPPRQLRALARLDVERLLAAIDRGQKHVVRAAYRESHEIAEVATSLGCRTADVQAVLDAGLNALPAAVQADRPMAA